MIYFDEHKRGQVIVNKDEYDETLSLRNFINNNIKVRSMHLMRDKKNYLIVGYSSLMDMVMDGKDAPVYNIIKVSKVDKNNKIYRTIYRLHKQEDI